MRTETPVAIQLADYKPYPFEIEQVSMTFDLNPKATSVVTKMMVRPSGSGPMVLDGEEMELNELKINGADLDSDSFDLTDKALTILAPPTETFELETRVTIAPEKNTALSGLYISGGRFCTQCESVGFRRITYYPDRPDVMSRFNVRIIANKATYPILLSNGTPGEAYDLNEGARHVAVWDDPHKKPSYLFALCAGDYDVYRDTFTTMSGNTIDLGVHVDKGDADRAAWAMDSLKRSMTWDEQVFAREYDLGVFNIVAVRDFNFGAMENKGLNIFNSAYVLADEDTATDADFEAIESIVAHEYFHNWTGNRITCRDWFQLCLKEGLTVFRDQEFSADMRSRPVQRIKDVIRLRARQFAEDAGPLAHAVRPDHYGSIDNLYTATVYEKGAEIIRMLKTMIGADKFAEGMALYFERHDGDAATLEDFYACFAEVADMDLTHFMTWYSQPGTPEVRIEESWDAGTGTFRAALTQINPQTPGQANKRPLPLPLSIALLDDDGTEYHARTMVMDTEATVIEHDGLAARPHLSINRGFSAPVRLTRDLDFDATLALAKAETDRFNQWDVFQSLLKTELLRLAYDSNPEGSIELIDSLGDAVETAAKTDPAFAALLMRLPDIGELMLERTPADPAALGKARSEAKAALADRLSILIDDTLSAQQPTPFDPGAEQAGIRALRSAAIDMLASLNQGHRLLGLYQSATNMTEKLSALRALARLHGTVERDEALSDFYHAWSANPLVMDKWFSAQAMSADAATVTNLLAHSDFDLKNPNRVRSVAGVFAAMNLPDFHALDGSGHRVLADVIAKADSLNPALAARLTGSFEQWRILEPKAAASAKSALEKLRDGDLSKNTSDIVSRALG